MSDEDTKYWIYAGGIPFELTEGDIICAFSQYGEITELSLSRDKETGRSRGFCFIKYEDPKSCELTVDNFNGTTIVGRRIKVSHANNSLALKNRKMTNVAPHEGSLLPIVETNSNKNNNNRSPYRDRNRDTDQYNHGQRHFRDANSPSPSPPRPLPITSSSRQRYDRNSGDNNHYDDRDRSPIRRDRGYSQRTYYDANGRRREDNYNDERRHDYDTSNRRDRYHEQSNRIHRLSSPNRINISTSSPQSRQQDDYRGDRGVYDRRSSFDRGGDYRRGRGSEYEADDHRDRRFSRKDLSPPPYRHPVDNAPRRDRSRSRSYSNDRYGGGSRRHRPARDYRSDQSPRQPRSPRSPRSSRESYDKRQQHRHHSDRGNRRISRNR